MMKNTSKTLALLLAAAVSGCASMGQPQQAVKSELADNTTLVTYEVKPGDRLSGIALKLTGEISNWLVIAERNDITDPTALGVGDALVIPSELLHEQAQGNSDSDNLANAELLQVANAAQTTPPVATGNGVSITRFVLPEPDKTWQVELFTVKANRIFDLKPFNTYGVSANSFSYVN